MATTPYKDLQNFLQQYQKLHILLTPIPILSQFGPQSHENEFQNTAIIDGDIADEQMSQIAEIIEDLKSGGKLSGKQSLGFAYEVDGMRLKNEAEERTRKMKEFFKGRAKQKKKYQITIPHSIGIPASHQTKN